MVYHTLFIQIFGNVQKKKVYIKTRVLKVL